LVFYRPFFGPKVETPKHAHEAPWSMLLGPVVLSGLGLLIGLLVAQFGEVIVGPAVSSILAEPTEVHLHLIPSQFNTTVMLSLITIAGGVGLYFARDPLARLVQPLDAV